MDIQLNQKPAAVSYQQDYDEYTVIAGVNKHPDRPVSL